MSRKVNVKVDNSAIFKDPNYVPYRRKKDRYAYEVQPTKEMEEHLRNMNGGPKLHLIEKTYKGGLKLTNSPLSKRGKRIRPDVIVALERGSAKAIASVLKGKSRKEIRRLTNHKNLKKNLKLLGVPVKLKKVVRRPDKYKFAFE